MGVKSSKHERVGPYRSWSYATTLELLRRIAAEDLGVPSDGLSVLEILQDVYAQGGMDAAGGLAAIAQTTGLPINVVMLSADEYPGNDKSADKDAPSTKPAGGSEHA